MATSTQTMHDSYGPWLVGGGTLAALARPSSGFVGTFACLGCAELSPCGGIASPHGGSRQITGLLLLAFGTAPASNATATPRTCSHLWPSSEDQTRQVLDRAFATADVSQPGTAHA